MLSLLEWGTQAADWGGEKGAQEMRLALRGHSFRATHSGLPYNWKDGYVSSGNVKPES